MASYHEGNRLQTKLISSKCHSKDRPRVHQLPSKMTMDFSRYECCHFFLELLTLIAIPFQAFLDNTIRLKAIQPAFVTATRQNS